MEAASSHQDQPLTPSASGEDNKPTSEAPAPAATKVSPGDGAFSPPNDDVQPAEGDDDEAVGFGPPPAFPGASKRQRTLMAVSASAAAGGAPLEELSSDDEAGEDGEGDAKPSQVIHRIQQGEARSPPAGETADKKNYSDAMLLASLSDVDSPKKQEEAVEEAVVDTEEPQPQVQVKVEARSPKSSGTTSSATTPLRSNLKPSPILEAGAKPFALLPKPRHPKAVSAAPAPQSPDGRDPKAARTAKNEGRWSREGYAQHPPQQPGQYPPGYGYPYGGHPAYAGHPAYPPGYPYYPGYGPPMGAPPGYPPRAYYPGHPQAPGAPPAPSSGAPPAERWGPYHSPKSQERKAASGPEPTPVRSRGPPSHPLASSSGESGRSHVVPSEERPPYDPRYGPPPPPPTSEGYYPGAEAYPAVSADENSPARGGAGSSHPGEYPPAPTSNASTPPRGHYEQYYEQAPPGYGPPPPGYAHPDSPPRSYGGPSPYGRAPPPPGAPHDPYEPYDYATASPNDAYQVPAAVSNEVEPRPVHSAHPPMPPPRMGPPGGYHQFRKGGRTVHSEPIILRKKFSWRNYPELEEYLIANRTDYLRHSALNYTAEQKHFNNRLTEGLLELAAKLNYVFDETCFNFVAVRDRIRCYYKSYVQSSKKRGVVVGFGKEKSPKRARVMDGDTTGEA